MHMLGSSPRNYRASPTKVWYHDDRESQAANPASVAKADFCVPGKEMTLACKKMIVRSADKPV